ncbi:YbjN domain-containing protein [Erythrobacter litoralis]|uniref:YbjN domain-containing protein n=1 Tax=Erythrobacter litoralis (strain HTCC2594) TaxID=314225 RepID=Q2NA07_ERYLH|nr:YbjN domain-containing protein [Erythrobacter litoralis]ABC63484.1 hypothetical protein ELI_06960 [Erythrobacter litoralis HTCC2594]
MRHLILAATIAAGTATMAFTPATAQSFSASRTLNSFDYDTLRATVTEIGGTIEPGQNDGFLIKFPNGTAATATFTACATGKCLGTNISARFGKPSDKTDSQVAELVRDYNRRWSAGKSYLTDDGRAVVQAYMIADGGISMENYRMQLVVYSQMLKKMRETIYKDG